MTWLLVRGGVRKRVGASMHRNVDQLAQVAEKMNSIAGAIAVAASMSTERLNKDESVKMNSIAGAIAVAASMSTERLNKDESVHKERAEIIGILMEKDAQKNSRVVVEVAKVFRDLSNESSSFSEKLSRRLSGLFDGQSNMPQNQLRFQQSFMLQILAQSKYGVYQIVSLLNKWTKNKVITQDQEKLLLVNGSDGLLDLALKNKNFALLRQFLLSKHSRPSMVKLLQDPALQPHILNIVRQLKAQRKSGHVALVDSQVPSVNDWFIRPMGHWMGKIARAFYPLEWFDVGGSIDSSLDKLLTEAKFTQSEETKIHNSLGRMDESRNAEEAPLAPGPEAQQASAEEPPPASAADIPKLSEDHIKQRNFKTTDVDKMVKDLSDDDLITLLKSTVATHATGLEQQSRSLVFSGLKKEHFLRVLSLLAKDYSQEASQEAVAPAAASQEAVATSAASQEAVATSAAVAATVPAASAESPPEEASQEASQEAVATSAAAAATVPAASAESPPQKKHHKKHHKKQ